MTTFHLPLRAAVLALCIAVVALASGCGKAGGNADADPASALPAAPIYFQMAIGPGSERDDLSALVNKVAPGDADVSKQLKDSFDQSASRGGDNVSYDSDIKPWLGKEAGITVSSFGQRPGVVAAVASKDNDKAKSLIDDQKGDKKSYNGVDYKVSGGTTVGLVGDFVVVGTTEVDFKKAVDAEKGQSLGDDKAFTDARSKAGSDNLGFLYADPKGLLKLLQSVPGAGAQLSQLGSIPGLNSDQPVTAAIKTDPNTLTVQTQAQAQPGQKSGADVSDLPGNAFVALASGGAGGQFQSQLKSIPANQRAVVNQQLRRTTGLDLDGLIGWLDSFEAYVSGSSISDLGVGVKLGSNNPTKSKRAVAAIAKLAARQANGTAKIKVSGSTVTITSPQLPQPVEIDGSGDSVNLSYGKPGDGKLSENPTFQKAVSKLGGATPSFFIGGGPIAALAGSAGAISPQAAQAKQALDAFDFVVAGSKVDGDTATGTLVFAVK